MNQVKVRNVIIGSGMPKICVPIIGRNKEEILSQAVIIKQKEPDLIEWRADWFDGIFDDAQMWEVLSNIRIIIENIPLLMTFRTSNEGGRKDISISRYEELVLSSADSGYIDILDIEAFFDENITREILKKIQGTDVKVILSNHNFVKTPKSNEIIKLLRRLHEFRPDMIKLAVMPNNKQDVIALLAATEEMSRMYSEIPVITMSMSKDGSISRFSGELFGSAVTFASAINSSAPGQADIDRTRLVLKVMHDMLKADM